MVAHGARHLFHENLAFVRLYAGQVHSRSQRRRGVPGCDGFLRREARFRGMGSCISRGESKHV